MVPIRTLKDLIHPEDHEPGRGWALVQEIVADAKVPVKILPTDKSASGATLEAIQVTTRSPMGAIAYYSGGLLLEDGWLRILGGPGLGRDLATWNFPDGDHCRYDEGGTMISRARCPGALLVADDVIGGFFAVNGGAFEGRPGSVFYLPPDTLVWEDLVLSYSEFFEWACAEPDKGLYSPYRWTDWKTEVSQLAGDRGLLLYPPLFADSELIEARTRGAVPVAELWKLYSDEFPRQLGLKS